MLTLEELDYELNYWKLTYSKHSKEKYLKYIECWKIDRELGNLLEIGTGPFMGVLPLVEAKIKVGIDANLDNFDKLGYLKCYRDIVSINGCFEDNLIKGKFDTIIMADGVENIDIKLKLISKLLIKYGRLYLHAHLRRVDQLTPGHKTPFSLEDLSNAMDDSNLRLAWFDKYDEDPIPQYTNGNKYTTIIGEWIR